MKNINIYGTWECIDVDEVPVYIRFNKDGSGAWLYLDAELQQQKEESFNWMLVRNVLHITFVTDTNALAEMVWQCTHIEEDSMLLIDDEGDGMSIKRVD